MWNIQYFLHVFTFAWIQLHNTWIIYHFCPKYHQLWWPLNEIKLCFFFLHKIVWMKCEAKFKENGEQKILEHLYLIKFRWNRKLDLATKFSEQSLRGIPNQRTRKPKTNMKEQQHAKMSVKSWYFVSFLVLQSTSTVALSNGSSFIVKLLSLRYPINWWTTPKLSNFHHINFLNAVNCHANLNAPHLCAHSMS